MLSKFMGLSGGIIALISLPFMIAFIGDLFVENIATADKATSAGLAAFFMAVLFAGVALFRRIFTVK